MTEKTVNPEGHPDNIMVEFGEGNLGLEIDGYIYRLVHIEDPPFRYGLGLDTPNMEI